VGIASALPAARSRGDGERTLPPAVAAIAIEEIGASGLIAPGSCGLPAADARVILGATAGASDVP